MIPKALAAKIRRAQDAVKDKRGAITYGERNEAKLRERESDLYDRLSAGDLSQYVYCLKLDAIQAKQERQRLRGPERLVELGELEQKLADIEAEVLRQVLAMRPSPGRVRWPRSLPPFGDADQKYRAELDEIDRRAAVKHEKVMARLEAESDKARIVSEKAMTRLAESLVEGVKKGKITRDQAHSVIRAVGVAVSVGSSSTEE